MMPLTARRLSSNIYLIYQTTHFYYFSYSYHTKKHTLTSPTYSIPSNSPCSSSPASTPYAETYTPLYNSSIFFFFFSFFYLLASGYPALAYSVLLVSLALQLLLVVLYALF